ncbi:hypothetical protein [Xylophilus sp. GOD-11R]|uniref:hypothetical protein n=1 Tax=Xylophilus sp. GOD-11R TaxID=3089814 RepID=UPI00298C8E44|nr:hypothetical protein [Xylophilus sp. GOD-11R]WPB57135.1 hypothetical protein R9X41_00270 [Xylophilus sp. GOD-11R]
MNTNPLRHFTSGSLTAGVTAMATLLASGAATRAMKRIQLRKRAASTAATGVIALAMLLPTTMAFAGLIRPPGEGTIAAKMYEQCMKEARTPWKQLLCHLKY